jgi:hypothetical protein
VVQYIGNTILISHYLLVCRLASFQRAASRPLEALGGPINRTQQQPPKPHLDFCLGCGIEPHRPTSEAATDSDLGSAPIDLSVLVDRPTIHSWISNILRGAGVDPRRALVNIRRTLHAQRFMRALAVKLLPPQIQRGLLRGCKAQAPGQYPGAFFHAPHCLLDVPDALVPNLSPRPATRPKADSVQRVPACAQTARHYRCEWLPATHNAQTILQNTNAPRLGPAIGQSLQLQRITTVFIPHRQRFAMLTRWIIPPTFKIHCPHRVGRLASSLRLQPPSLRPPSLRGSVIPARASIRLKLLSEADVPCIR